MCLQYSMHTHALTNGEASGTSNKELLVAHGKERLHFPLNYSEGQSMILDSGKVQQHGSTF